MIPDRHERLITLWLFSALLAFNAWGISVGWNNGFLPGNEFRQTHTAITALFIQQENNFSLTYPTPLLGKPWSIPYEFPLYQWTVVRVSNATGLALTQSARAVSWTCFYLALPAIWLLLGRLRIIDPRRLIVLGMVLSCPLYIFYARAFLIETMALMFSLWFLVAFVAAVERRSIPWLLLANVAGAGAGLVKVTTFMLYLVPAAVWSLVWLWRERPRDGAPSGRWRGFAGTLGWIVAATAVPFASTLWWIRFADGIKALNLSGRLLLSDAMTSYHFGTSQTRLDPGLWRIFWHTIVTNLAPVLTLAAFALTAVLVGGRWRKWILGCVLVFAAGPVIFPLLYSWHEYYFSANGVLLMTAIGLSLCALLESNRPRWLVWVVVFGVHASQAWTYRNILYPIQQEVNHGGSGLTRLLHDTTGPNDVLVIAGDDWAPMIPYYAQRRALMLRRGMDRDGTYRPAAFATLKGERVPVLILRGDARDNPDLREVARTFFGIASEPVAQWENATVFVHPDLRPRLIKQYHAAAYEGVLLIGKAFEEADALQFVERSTASLPAAERRMFDAFSPQPVKFSSRFALGLIPFDHRQVLMAHPHSRLWFAPPAGRHRISADYGILPNAYEKVALPEVAPEGVTFSIIRSRGDGSSEVLFKRFLNPTELPSDRGVQQLELSVQLNPGDQLAFVTGPGPRGTYNRTWSYWGAVQIK